MSRSQKRRRKEELEKRRSGMWAGRQQPARGRDELLQAASLMERGRWPEARQILEEYESLHPGHPDALHMLLGVLAEQQDYGPYCRTCERLIEQEPDDRSMHLALAGAYQCHARFASALLAFRWFVERWPYDPQAAAVHESIAELEAVLEEVLREAPFPADERIELAALHEGVLNSIAAGDPARTIRAGEELLARSPNFIPVMNNLSHAYFHSGRTIEAVAMAQRVLNKEPDNFHALANLAQFLLLAGRADEAETLLKRLRSVSSDKRDVWCKKAETFSYFGDDKAVLEAFAGAHAAGVTADKTPDVGLLYHLAGVAAARQGDDRQARRHWQAALQVCPTLDLARDNLTDADRPAADRQGAWPFSMKYWIRGSAVERLKDALGSPAARKDDDAVTQAMRRFCIAFPEMATLVPLLLDRGDEPARKFAWKAAILLETPEMFEALRVFCLSQSGPDSLRIETADRLCQKDVLPAGRLRMWISGEWQEIELAGFEIINEPMGPGCASREADEWHVSAIEALQRGNGPAAEELLKRCLEVEGDRPELLNNLALAYQIQGRDDEHRTLVHQIHERWPDYFFGRVALACLATRAGEYPQADDLLAPLRQRRRLHATEFSTLCGAYIRLMDARGDANGAQSWLDIFRAAQPDHPDVKQCEQILKAGGMLGTLSRLFRGRDQRRVQGPERPHFAR